jgi:hypothetical protein
MTGHPVPEDPNNELDEVEWSTDYSLTVDRAAQSVRPCVLRFADENR